MREIVSEQFRHRGGFARVEMDQGEHFFVTCSGCQSEEYKAGLAPALAALVQHTEQ